MFVEEQQALLNVLIKEVQNKAEHIEIIKTATDIQNCLHQIASFHNEIEEKLKEFSQKGSLMTVILETKTNSDEKKEIIDQLSDFLRNFQTLTSNNQTQSFPGVPPN